MLPLEPISPLGTMRQVWGTITNAPGSRQPIEYLSPWIQAAWHAGRAESPYGAELGPGWGGRLESVRQNVERLAPAYRLGRDIVSPPAEAGMYPWDVTRAGRLARATGVVPVPIDVGEARKSAVREGRVKGPRDFTAAQENAQWARDHKDILPSEVVKYAIGARKLDDAVERATDAAADRLGVTEEEVPDSVEYETKYRILARMRPELKKDAGKARAFGRAVMDPEQGEDLKEAVNDLLEYADKFKGVRISALIEAFQNQPVEESGFRGFKVGW
jgi:hypothetical protein